MGFSGWSMNWALARAAKRPPLDTRSSKRAGFHDPALVEDQDPVRIADRGETVRDDQRCPPGHHLLERLLELDLRAGVESRGGFVENEDRRVLEQRAGNGQALALSS